MATDTQTARQALENGVGQVWNTAELRQDYEVVGFAAPFVRVTRRADGTPGTLEFQHAPRLYYRFSSD